MAGPTCFTRFKGNACADPVPVEKEPHHHVEWKNEFVEVIHVVLPAGESTLFHTHSRDRVAVDLTSTMLALQKLNEPEEQPERSIPGTFQPELTPMHLIHTDYVMLGRRHMRSLMLSFFNGQNILLRRLLRVWLPKIQAPASTSGI